MCNILILCLLPCFVFAAFTCRHITNTKVKKIFHCKNEQIKTCFLVPDMVGWENKCCTLVQFKRDGFSPWVCGMGMVLWNFHEGIEFLSAALRSKGSSEHLSIKTGSCALDPGVKELVISSAVSLGWGRLHAINCDPLFQGHTEVFYHGSDGFAFISHSLWESNTSIQGPEQLSKEKIDFEDHALFNQSERKLICFSN